jgi:hypothetical protein
MVVMTAGVAGQGIVTVGGAASIVEVDAVDA